MMRVPRSPSTRRNSVWRQGRLASSIREVVCWAAAGSAVRRNRRQHRPAPPDPFPGGKMEISELTEELRKQAGRNVRLGYKVKFVIDDGIIFWDGTGDTPDIGNEDKGEADTTITITAENLQKLMQGGLDPTLGYMTGKLKVE